MHFKPSQSHHTHIHVHGKIVFHKTGSWCQKDWGLLAYRVREGNGTPLQYSCLENPMNGVTWWAAVHGVAKSRTRLSDFTFTFHFHALNKEMATHSIVLAWRIPGMAEPGRLLSMGSHRVRHDWSDLAAAAACGVDSHSLLQGIFLTQGWNPGLLHCRQILYSLSHQGGPYDAAVRTKTSNGTSGLLLAKQCACRTSLCVHFR